MHWCIKQGADTEKHRLKKTAQVQASFLTKMTTTTLKPIFCCLFFWNCVVSGLSCLPKKVGKVWDSFSNETKIYIAFKKASRILKIRYSPAIYVCRLLINVHRIAGIL